MTRERVRRSPLPESARQTLDDFTRLLPVTIRLWQSPAGSDERIRLYPDASVDAPEPLGTPWQTRLVGWPAAPLDLEVWTTDGAAATTGPLVASTLERTIDLANEVRLFTYEVAERFEEINLLYSLSETLGSTLGLEEGATSMLAEVCGVIGARRGSIWVHDPEADALRPVASYGEHAPVGPMRIDDPEAVSARVFRDNEPLIAGPGALVGVLRGVALHGEESVLSVPIRYTPPGLTSRTIGVINLVGRPPGGGFTAADQKLLLAIASQVGAAIENNRLVQQTLAREGMAREMELAHNLQKKLLPSVDRLHGAHVAARVEPAEQVGGDFYQVFQLEGGRVGLMIGDVSGHGFPAALIMALSLSAASIFASEFSNPEKVLQHVDEAIRDELESTEMYLSLFYGVLDPAARSITWSNAGHPHAFLVSGAGDPMRLDATEAPVGIALQGSYSSKVTPWNPDADLVALFTDGLSDALARTGPGEGEARVMAEIVARRGESPADIVDALFAQVAAAEPTLPSDDRTLLVMAGG